MWCVTLHITWYEQPKAQGLLWIARDCYGLLRTAIARDCLGLLWTATDCHSWGLLRTAIAWDCLGLLGIAKDCCGGPYTARAGATPMNTHYILAVCFQKAQLRDRTLEDLVAALDVDTSDEPVLACVH